jgi:hypothetical protein
LFEAFPSTNQDAGFAKKPPYGGGPSSRADVPPAIAVRESCALESLSAWHWFVHPATPWEYSFFALLVQAFFK